MLRMNIPIKFTASWQPGNAIIMASTNVCRLDSRSSVNLFTVIGLKNKWASRISALLQVAVDNDQMLTSHVCTKCTRGLVALENTKIYQQQSSLRGTFYTNVSNNHTYLQKATTN